MGSGKTSRRSWRVKTKSSSDNSPEASSHEEEQVAASNTHDTYAPPTATTSEAEVEEEKVEEKEEVETAPVEDPAPEVVLTYASPATRAGSAVVKSTKLSITRTN